MTLAASIVVPTRDRAAVIALTVPRLLAQEGIGAYEVIVVDDGSTDDTGAALDRLASPRLVALRQPQAGASAARNRALAVARGEVVAFVDDDAFVEPDFLARHLRHHVRDERALVAGGIVEVRDPPAPGWLASLPPWRGYHRHPMPGGNASVRLGHIQRAGGFDSEMCTYGWQDQELAERLLRLGLVRRFAWGAPIAHYKPARTVLDPRHELERELDRGRMGARFYAKHPRVLVGITTKMWAPIRLLDRVAARPLGLARDSAAILSGEPVMEEFRGARAALLRAHVEIRAGERELARISRAGSSPASPAAWDAASAGRASPERSARDR